METRTPYEITQCYLPPGRGDMTFPPLSSNGAMGAKSSVYDCLVVDMPHRRRLRSASTEQLDVPTCRRSTIVGRAFPVAGAKVWNSLPSEVTSASSLPVFKNRLKTYLFRRCYETV